jgi:hypothetical protein
MPPSRVKELADEEAAKAEAEQPDEDAIEQEETTGSEPEPQPEPDPSPVPAPEPASEEAQMKAMGREYDRHAKALERIIGEDFAMLAPCDHCGGLGFAPPVTLRPHKNFRACETCNGFGDVLTGSRKEGNATQPCPVCAGRGYLERLEQPAAPLAPQQPNGPQPQPEYGVPSWMGNPQVGQVQPPAPPASPGY